MQTVHAGAILHEAQFHGVEDKPLEMDSRKQSVGET